MARTSTGVKFVLKNPKATNSPVKAIFCYAKTQMYYYERKLSIPTRFWNKKSQRAKETSAFEGYSEFNSTLNSIESTILDCYRKFKNDVSREPFVEQLREMVKASRGYSSSVTKPMELLEFIEAFIADAKAGRYVNQARGTTIAPVTVRTYEQTFGLLKAYGDHKKIKLKFEDINVPFHKNFNHFLSKIYVSEETNRSLKINTIGKHFTNIKTFMSAALERKLTTNDSCRSKSFKVIREDVDNIALSEIEISALEDLDLSTSKRLEKVRDMFLIGCETGLRISDLKRLKSENIIDDKFIRIEMKKTGNPVVVPLSDRVKKIIKKYESSLGDYFPKAVSDQKANDYIKEVAKKVPLLCETVEINCTENGFRVSKSVPKHELISNHTARRSFATLWALRGTPYSMIMKMTGHKSEKSFARYIKVNEMQAARLFEMQMLNSKLQVV